MGMSYEQKMRILACCKPEAKDKILARIIKGERSVDITGDKDLWFRINQDRMPMSELVNRQSEKFLDLKADMREFKKDLVDPKFGKTRDKKARYLGEIPDTIYFTHPWFSPLLPKEERDANIRRFFREFPAFRAGDKEI